MPTKVLRKFGVLRRVFRGVGSIRLSDGSDVRTRFTLGQLADTRLLICADADGTGLSPWKFMSGNLEAESLQGTLRDGRRISATDLRILSIKEIKSTSIKNKARLVSLSGHWTINGSSISGQASVVFELVNFCYLGTEAEHGRLSLMSLVLGGRHVQLRWTTDYDHAVATLRAQRGVQVTCTATTTISSLTEIDETESMMDKLCDVASVARGTLVNWITLEVQSANGISLHSHYRNAVTRRYAGIEVIGDDKQHETKRFLEEGFRNCEELDKDFQVRKIARAFIETRDGAFLESRSLLIAVLVEYLASVRARLDNRIEFISPKTFKAGLKTLKAKTEITLKETYPDIQEEEHLYPMLENIKGLNRRPLRQKLDGLVTWLQIDCTPDEIGKFVNARNRLAHEGRFPDNEPPMEHYRRMQHFLDRIILRLFGYQGVYYDFEHGKTRQL